MKEFKCENCTSSDLISYDGPNPYNQYVVCQHCGTKYEVENDSLSVIAIGNGATAVKGNNNLVITNGNDGSAAVDGNGNVIITGNSKVGFIGNGITVKGGIHFG